MPIQKLTRQVGDTLIPVAATITDVDGDAVDVSSLDVLFTMLTSDGVVKVAETAADKIDAANGEVQYDLQDADVDTAGTYYAYFITEDGSGEQNTYPVEQGDFRITFVEPGSADIDIDLAATWDSLRADTAHFLGWTRDEAAWDPDEEETLSAIIKAALLQVYYPQSSKPGVVHQWSWMRPAVTIDTVAPYATGTVTVASGVVTLSDGTFATTSTWAAYGELTVDGETYTVDSYDSTTQLTLDDTSVTVTDASAYSLARVTYALPSTFGGSFDGNLMYEPGSSVLWPPVRMVSDAMIRRMRQDDTSTERPTFAAVRPSSFVPATGQRWELTFFRAPNGAYTLHGRYKVTPTMIDSVNKYPLGGVAVSGLHLESCLAIAEQRLNDQGGGFHTERFAVMLASAVADDADSYSPHFLGYNADGSDGHRGRSGEHDGTATHSYEGTVYRDVRR